MVLSLIGASVSLSTAHTVAATDPYSSAVLADSPISYWRLNDASGTSAVDQTGNDNGAITGGVTLGQPGPVPGGGAMTFDGTTGYVDLGTNANLFPQQWSIEAWFKASSESQAGCANAGLIYRNRHWGMELQANAAGSVASGGYSDASTGYGVQSSSSGYLDNQWHHVVATHDAGSITIYVDGVQAGTASAAAGTYYAQSDGIAIGRDGSCSCSYFAGSLAEVAIYNHALAATRVAAHFSAAGCGASLPAVYTGSLAAATDGQSGYSQTLTACGTAPFSWSLQSGSLPAGLTLSSSGVISGSLAANAATSTFTVAVTDSTTGTGTEQFTLTVNPPPVVTTTTVQPANPGQVGYSQTLAVSGGTAPMTWSLQSGSSLPTGLTLTSVGVISGNVDPSATTSTFTVVVTDANGVPAAKQLTLSILPAPPSGRGGPDLHGGLHPDPGSAAVLPCTSGEPVNCDTGNLIEEATDLSVPGRGRALRLTRTYNALDAATATTPHRLGYGWSDSTSVSLRIDTSTAPAQAIVTSEDGSTIRFAGQGGVFTPIGPWVIARLAQNPDGTSTYTLPDQAVDVFGPNGSLAAERDRDGNTTTFGYDLNGRLISVTDPAGRTLTYGLGANGLVSTATDPLGRVVHYGYDGAGDLTSVTDPAGSVTRYGYDPQHRLTTLTRPNGGVTTNVFDTANRVTSQTDPLGHTISFVYGAGTTTITDPTGVTVETYQNDLLASLTKGSGSPQQATWTYGYTAADERNSVTDPDGHTSTATFDAAGNLLTSADGLGNTTTYAYDALNDLTSVTDPLGHVTTIARDAVGHVTSVSQVHTEDGRVAVTRYAYGDPSHPGDVTAVTDPDGNTSTFVHDAAGDLTRSTDAAGDATTFGYNAIGWRTTLTAPLGNVAGGNPAQHTATTTFDGVGDVLTSTDAAGDTTTNTFDADHNLVRQKDANGHVTVHVFDLADQPTEVDEADGTVTRTSYAAGGQIATQTDGLGAVTGYTYDPLRRLASETDPLKRTTTYGYDGAGNQVSVTDPMGRTTTLGYDAANQLTGVAYSDGVTHSVAFQYDADGNRLTMADGTGTSTYQYDSLGRLSQSVNGGGDIVGYGDTLAGRLATLTYPTGNATASIGGTGPLTAGVVTRTYNPAGQVASITDWQNHTTTFSYDADGNLITEALPGGVSTALTYDSADRLTQSTSTGPQGSILNLPYTRDGLGQLTSANPLATSPAVTQAYGYDPSNRLLSSAIPAPGGLASVPNSTYGYDAANNLTSSTTGGTLTTTLGYDAANELLSTSNATGSTAYTYNPNGDRLTRKGSQGGLSTYGYDQADRLTSYIGPAMNQANAQLQSVGAQLGVQLSGSLIQVDDIYNGDGLRTAKAVSGTPVINEAWDVAEGQPLLLQDGLTDYVTDPSGLPLEQVQPNGTTLFYLHDQLGSTRALTDSNGHVAASYAYDPYGNPLGTLPAVANPFQYAGQYKDVESGLYYLRARYYDPATAQFLTRDPMVATTRSPYGYVGGNPLNASDPTGLCLALVDSGCGFSLPSPGEAINRLVDGSQRIGNIFGNASTITGGAAAIPTPVSPLLGAVSLLEGGVALGFHTVANVTGAGGKPSDLLFDAGGLALPYVGHSLAQSAVKAGALSEGLGQVYENGFFGARSLALGLPGLLDSLSPEQESGLAAAGLYLDPTTGTYQETGGC